MPITGIRYSCTTTKLLLSVTVLFSCLFPILYLSKLGATEEVEVRLGGERRIVLARIQTMRHRNEMNAVNTKFA